MRTWWRDGKGKLSPLLSSNAYAGRCITVVLSVNSVYSEFKVDLTDGSEAVGVSLVQRCALRDLLPLCFASSIGLYDARLPATWPPNPSISNRRLFKNSSMLHTVTVLHPRRRTTNRPHTSCYRNFSSPPSPSLQLSWTVVVLETPIWGLLWPIHWFCGPCLRLEPWSRKTSGRNSSQMSPSAKGSSTLPRRFVFQRTVVAVGLTVEPLCLCRIIVNFVFYVMAPRILPYIVERP